MFEPTSLQWYNKQDWSESMTDIIALRGSKGTHPENTCIAFREGVRVGADGIELDVHL
ncbi:glycerophosphodiester phosphodiesterase family protein, partial [Enterococcus faecalis]|uniref:glycerophosphodiester phosphodiesterase family protein n=1 Tax=Enterococcus faecalis TaxID=1351 RepID=UPI003CC59C95